MGVAQNRLDSFRLFGDVRIVVDRPEKMKRNKSRMLVLYALPNGNSIEWTMGKRIQPGEDWHFDIQHIAAQTSFVREQMKDREVIVVYLENNQRSWPAWKKAHTDFTDLIPGIVNTLSQRYGNRKTRICLTAHSGGGIFIFGYLQAQQSIPPAIERICFIDANYGYDSSYAPALRHWMEQVPAATLLNFAYNDSVALYNGKPLVTPTGGTWYRSQRMMEDLGPMQLIRSDSLLVYEDRKRKQAHFLRTNPERRIYHTQQVERNGFIHSLLYGTPYEDRGYRYYVGRAYTDYLKK